MDRIVKILEVVDTRTWEEGADDKWYPIPGSGIEHECDRCGRFHEIHATVLLESGKAAIVGTGCMGREDIEMAKRFQQADRAAKRLAQLKSEYASQKAKEDAWLGVLEQIKSLAPPQATIEERVSKDRWDFGKIYYVYVVGDAWRRVPTPEEMAHFHANFGRNAEELMKEALDSAIDQWRSNRLEELNALRPGYTSSETMMRDIVKTEKRLAQILAES